MFRTFLIALLVLLIFVQLAGAFVLWYRKKYRRDDFVQSAGWWLACFLWPLPLIIGLALLFPNVIDPPQLPKAGLLSDELLDPKHPRASERVLFSLGDGMLLKFPTEPLFSINSSSVVSYLEARLDGVKHVLVERSEESPGSYRIPTGFESQITTTFEFVPGLGKSQMPPFRIPVTRAHLHKYVELKAIIERQLDKHAQYGSFTTEQKSLTADALLYVVTDEEAEAFRAWEYDRREKLAAPTMRVWGVGFIGMAVVMVGCGITLIRLFE